MNQAAHLCKIANETTPADLIGQISDFTKGHLTNAWAEEFRRPTPSGFSRDLLVRSLAWRIQEKACGGHDKEIVKLLNDCAHGRAEKPLFGRLKSGTVIVREHQGVRHTVTIAKDGFIWREQTYTSLSVIARLITGTNWNGPRFFGLRDNEHRPNRCVEGPP